MNSEMGIESGGSSGNFGTHLGDVNTISKEGRTRRRTRKVEDESAELKQQALSKSICYAKATDLSETNTNSRSVRRSLRQQRSPPELSPL
jgi:hypothetical protein